MRRAWGAFWRWLGHASTIHWVWVLGVNAVLTVFLRTIINLGPYWFLLFFAGVTLILLAVSMRWGPLAKYTKPPFSVDVVSIPISAITPDAAASPPNHGITLPTYSDPSDLEHRRRFREFVTTKLAEMDNHLQQEMRSGVRAFHGPSIYERKWTWDTYLGLRDFDDFWARSSEHPDYAELFGHPDYDRADARERVDRLKDILEISSR